MYRTIDASFWTDQKVRKLAPLDRLLFLYLITNPHTHVSGLYYLPEGMIQHETGLTKSQLGYGIDTLSKTRRALFDPPNELVWVVKMFRFQGKGLKNTLSAARHIENDLHNSFLVSEFLKAYPEVEPHVKNRVSHTLSEFGTPHSPFPIPEQEQEQENGERKGDMAAEAAPPLLTLGEFGNAKVTEAQHEKLKTTLGPKLDSYITRFDRWIEQLKNPKTGKLPAKYRNRQAYLSISSWFETDTEKGNSHGTRQQNRPETPASGRTPRPYTPKQ